jgi:alkylhydroperoxidase family enzyme
MTIQRISESVWAGFGGDGRNAAYVRLGHGVPGLLAGSSEHDGATFALVQAAGGTVGTVVGPDAGTYRMCVPDGARVVATPGTAEEIASRGLIGEVTATPGSPLAAYLAKPRLTAGIPAARWTVDQMVSGWWTPVVGTDTVVALDIGRAYGSGDAVVWLAGEGVLLTGALVTNGMHPASWYGSLANWQAACARLAELHPTQILPGYGWPGDGSLVTTMRDYLDNLRTEAESRYHKGMPVEDAAVDVPLGAWSNWACPEHLAITLATAYREFGAPEDSVADVLTTVAEIATGIRCRSRIAPLAPGDREVEINEEPAPSAVEPVRPQPSNIQSTLARHPSLYEQSAPIIQGVYTGLLPVRHREIAILRSAWACSAAYQWNHHRRIALEGGLTEDEIDLLSQPADAGDWTPHERAVLSAVDELHANAVVSDATWTTLSRTYGERELIELVTLIGEYHKISFQLNSWGVSLEQGFDRYHLPSGWRRLPGEQTPQRRPPSSAMTVSGTLPVTGERHPSLPLAQPHPSLGGPDGHGRHRPSTLHSAGQPVGDLVQTKAPGMP